MSLIRQAVQRLERSTAYGEGEEWQGVAWALCESRVNDGSETPSRLVGRLMLAASEPDSTASALAVSVPWKTIGGHAMVSHGFVGRNDGYADPFGGANDRTMDWRFHGAYGGNVAQIGWLDLVGCHGAGRSALQRRIVAALIVENEARPFSRVWWKAWASLL